jgi:hypothetical protein
MTLFILAQGHEGQALSAAVVTIRVADRSMMTPGVIENGGGLSKKQRRA